MTISVTLQGFFAGWNSQIVQPASHMNSLPVELKYMLIDYLSCTELSRLGQCSKTWNYITTPELYIQDVREGNSYAIKWAASVKDKKSTKFAISTLKKSVKYGGNINEHHRDFPTQRLNGITFYERATALHYAIASQNLDIVRWLLAMGARVEYPCSGRDWAMKVLRPDLVKKELGHYSHFFPGGAGYGLWTPLFLAFLLNNWEIGQLLLRHSASSKAIISIQTSQHPRCTSILHFIASDKTDRFGKWKKVFTHFRANMYSRSMDNSNTTLHVAMRSGNIQGVDLVLQHGALIESLNASLNTPLIEGIMRVQWTQPRSLRRKEHIECVKHLVERGANVNPPGNSALATAVGYYTDNILATDDLRMLVHFLVRKGADINGTCSSGLTALQVACIASISNGQFSPTPKSLRSLIQDLIKMGANTSQASQSQMTPLNIVMQSFGPQSYWLFNLLCKNGAKIHRHEADGFFLKWCSNPRLYNERKFNVWEHAPHISHRAIERAYKMALMLPTRSLYSALQRCSFPPPANYDLVRYAFTANNKWSWRAILGSDFAATFTTSAAERRENILQLTIRVYNRVENYTAVEASRDMTSLIKRGANITHLNKNNENVMEVFELTCRYNPFKEDSGILYRMLCKEIDKMMKLKNTRG